MRPVGVVGNPPVTTLGRSTGLSEGLLGSAGTLSRYSTVYFLEEVVNVLSECLTVIGEDDGMGAPKVSVTFGAVSQIVSLSITMTEVPSFVRPRPKKTRSPALNSVPLMMTVFPPFAGPQAVKSVIVRFGVYAVMFWKTVTLLPS